MPNKTAFIGLSHMGQVTSICWAYLGIEIIGVDENKKVLKDLKSDKLPREESELNKVYKKAKKNLSFTSDFTNISQAKSIFFTQDTSLSGIDHLKNLKKQIIKSIPYICNGATIVIMSQVPPSFCRQTSKTIKNKRPDLKFHLYHWVDTIIMTQAVNRILHPERIILGSIDKNSKLSSDLLTHLSLFDCPVIRMTYESAEITKAAINLYLSTSVTYANTLSDYCEATGANINDVVKGLRLDKRIGQFAYLRPSLGIAGGHLERDLSMLEKLAKQKGISSGVVGYINSTNKKRYQWATKTLKKYLYSSNKKYNITVWGLAYKKDTDSTHNAASLKILPKLATATNISVYDPMAIMPKSVKGYKRYYDKYESLSGSDCLLILTEWDEFRDLDIRKTIKAMNQKLIIDSVGILYEKRQHLKDFRYISMGIGEPVDKR